MNGPLGAYDLAIIGGGINGCGIARDAAGRGNSVFLCEMNDLASGTSSWSSKLIHGGLRYLEYYEFRLVHEALLEREVIWKIAPHIVRLIGGPDHRFVLPASALLGALLIVVADTMSRTLVAPAELPIGVVTSAIGAPFFFWLLRTRTHYGASR